jgi:cytochrome d ubiquinol oxidase subunit I
MVRSSDVPANSYECDALSEHTDRMDHLLAARAQMGTSLAFHFIFSALGIGLPVLLIIVEGMWLRTREPRYYKLARTWARATGVLFAIGAVSGTTLSFELGLLWPEFMRNAGSIIGLPFSAEGFAFFIEAIFVGIYLYGWDRLSPVGHWLTGFPIAISGALSGLFVVSANAWMNTPAGFTDVHGHATNIHPWAAVLNPAMPTEVLHTTLAAYVFTGFAVAAVYAFSLLRNPGNAYLAGGMKVAMMVGVIAIPLQFVMGDVSARFDADREPIKLAAMEGQYKTVTGAPLRIGGIPNDTTRQTNYALELPYGLSILAYENPHATVRGLDSFPRNDVPNALPIHLSFQAMVGSASALLALAGWWAFATRFGRRSPNVWMLRATVLSGFAAFVAMEAGWMVTELGRQPWIVHGFLRTSQAVTTAPALDITFYGFSLLYVGLAVTLGWLLLRLGKAESPEAPATTLPRGTVPAAR